MAPSEDTRMLEVSIVDLKSFLDGFRHTGNRYMAIDDIESFLMDYRVGPDPEEQPGDLGEMEAREPVDWLENSQASMNARRSDY